MPRLDRNGNLIGGTVPNSGSGSGGGGGSGEVDEKCEWNEVEVLEKTEVIHTHNLGKFVEIEGWREVNGSLVKSDGAYITRTKNDFTFKTLTPFTGTIYYR